MIEMCPCSSNQKTTYEIGSYFDVNPIDVEKKTDSELTPSEPEVRYLSTCRSAISLILDTLTKRNCVALLPAFTCHAVAEPFVENGFSVEPYPINKDLTVDVGGLEDQIQRFDPDVVLFHDYFGFDTNRRVRKSGIIERLRRNGKVIIDDRTQSMFSAYVRCEADFVVGSIRKWMGIPDGAFIYGLNDSLTLNEDTALVEAKLKAMNYKHNYLYQNEGMKECVLPLYREAEALLDSRKCAYKMSSISKRLLSNYDIDAFNRKRQDNASFLIAGIKNVSFIELANESPEENEVPFYVPVFIKKDRKEIQSYLAKNGVYATVIWGCPDEFKGKISVSSQAIYDEILCIPCDQRYTRADMEYICKLIKSY